MPRTIESKIESAVAQFDASQAIERAVHEHPEFVRAFATAMGKSGINATRGIALIAGLSRSVTEPLEREQLHFLRHYGEASQNKFLAYEALIMKRCWQCYDMAARQERYGSRKKSRFVREHVTNPAGRARGYSAIDAAINYMHQRRLFKARYANAELGLSSYSEGFLHRKR